MKCLFLIPARAGSKGLPGKNLAVVGGISLLGRCIRAATRASKRFPSGSRVVCSTDDENIAAEARSWGAEVPFIRPVQLASDEASSMDVILHAIDTLQEAFHAVVLLQPTSPLTDSADVVRAIELFSQSRGPVVSVTPACHPVEWHFTIAPDGTVAQCVDGSSPHRRQDAVNAVRPNGAIYIASPSHLRHVRSFWTSETRAYAMPADRSVDIDNQTDLEVARALLAKRGLDSVSIAGRPIGPGRPCFVIAEAGVNHNGDLEIARRLIDIAAEAGADAVKFQTFRAEDLVTQDAPKAEYQLRTTGVEQSQFEMLKSLELTESAHRELMEHCARRRILFLSTPFSESAADLLDSLGVMAFKLPSGELTNLPFLRHVGSKGKPVILSTGMANLQEVSRAVDALREAGCRELTLLHCVSNYPADPADANLRAMHSLRDAFGVPVGFSDHMEGDSVALAAAALGAAILEKHFTVDRSLPGPDHQSSIEPGDLRELVRRVRIVQAALGDGRKVAVRSEMEVASVARRSIVAAVRIAAGTRLQDSMVTFRRPGTGLPPEFVQELVGRYAIDDIEEGAILQEEMFR